MAGRPYFTAERLCTSGLFCHGALIRHSTVYIVRVAVRVVHCAERLCTSGLFGHRTLQRLFFYPPTFALSSGLVGVSEILKQLI
jgi:hypothetical protein